MTPLVRLRKAADLGLGLGAAVVSVSVLDLAYVLDELERTKSPVSPDRSASSPNLPGLSGGGDAVPPAASPVYDPEGEA